MKITAAVVHEKNGKFHFEEVELAKPNDNELLVKVVASGICHTDEFGRSDDIDIPFPLVLGHEGAGIVMQAGANVQHIKEGDHVVFSYAFCDQCKFCLTGQPYNCENYNEINFGGVASDGKTRITQDGKPVSMFFGQSSFATHAVVHNKSVVKVDKDLDLAYLAPLGCGIQTGAGAVLNTLKPEMHSSIIIFGCGSVGMSAIMAAKTARVQTIIAVGGNPNSLALAKTLGATHAINRKETSNLLSSIKEIVPKGVNYAIETSGYGPLILASIQCTSYHGKIIVLSPNGVLENFNIGTDVLMNMRTIQGICEGDSVAQIFIPELVDLYKNGEFPMDRLIKIYDFKDIEQAFLDSANGKVIKAVVRI